MSEFKHQFPLIFLTALPLLACGQQAAVKNVTPVGMSEKISLCYQCDEATDASEETSDQELGLRALRTLLEIMKQGMDGDLCGQPETDTVFVSNLDICQEGQCTSISEQDLEKAEYRDADTRQLYYRGPATFLQMRGIRLTCMYGVGTRTKSATSFFVHEQNGELRYVAYSGYEGH